MTTSTLLCACGCEEITTTTPQGVQRTWRPGHNRRVVGSRGWMEGGYRFIRVDGTKIAEHRYIVEQKLGRKLTSNQIVHHIDWNPLNNDPGNLVILSRSEHQRLHACVSRKLWTTEEKERSRELRQARMTIQEIATVLARPFSNTSLYLAKWAKESRLASAPV